jgi:hypothetical protein
VGPFLRSFFTYTYSHSLNIPSKTVYYRSGLDQGFHDIVIYQLELSYPLTTFHLPVLFGVELNVRQKIPEHLVFDYKNADCALFRRKMDS